MYVISANYNDRHGPKKWLVRKEGTDPSEATPCKNVVATGVRFQRSSSYEQGFGCSMVAVAKNAAFLVSKKWGGDESPLDTDFNDTQPVPLGFNGTGFYDKDSNEDVEVCDFLSLSNDGSMQYIANIPVRTTKTEVTPFAEDNRKEWLAFVSKLYSVVRSGGTISVSASDFGLAYFGAYRSLPPIEVDYGNARELRVFGPAVVSVKGADNVGEVAVVLVGNNVSVEV